jgi:hypothetical protein
MRKVIFAVLGIVIATLVLHAGSVNAQNYPWCAQRGDGATNCGFPPTNNAWRQAAGAIAIPCFSPLPRSAITWQPKRASPKTLIPRLQRQRRRRRRRRRIAVLARDLVLVEVVKGTGFAGMKAIIVGGGSAALLRR